jgi:ABC-2 type transport system permease protein
MIEDDTVQINSMLNGTQYLNALQLVENTLDWSTADSTLLSLRNQGHFARTLEPLEDKQKRNWELLNYVIALLGLLAVYGVYRIVQRQTLEGYEKKLNLV